MLLGANAAFASESPQTLTVTLDVRARWLLLPMTFTLHGRITANPADGTFTYTDLSATGHDPGGNLAAAFLNGPLKKMNAQTQQMVAFGDDSTRITSARFAADDGITFTVEFGR